MLMLSKFGFSLRVLWNARRIFAVLDWKTFPDIGDGRKVRAWILGRLDDMYALAVSLTPGWTFDDHLLDEIRKVVRDDDSWNAIYWAISMAVVPLFSTAATKHHFSGLTGRVFYRDGTDDAKVATNPMVIASVLSIIVSTIRLVKWLRGDKVGIPDADHDQTELGNGGIPDLDDSVLIPRSKGGAKCET